MFKPLLVLLGLVLGSSTGFAQTVVNVQDTSCSGIQSSSLNSPLYLNCSGDFALNRGVLADNSGIFLSATGALTLDNITISAPTIQFDAGTSISVGGNVSLAGSNISLVSGAAGTTPLLFSSSPVGNPVISSGGAAGALSFTQSGSVVTMVNWQTDLSPDLFVVMDEPLILTVNAVPEPSSYVTILAGLLCLAGFRRVCRRKV